MTVGTFSVDSKMSRTCKRNVNWPDQSGQGVNFQSCSSLAERFQF